MFFFDTNDLKTSELYLSLVGTYEADVEKGWVPFYQFDICLLDDTKIGFCNLRIDNTELTKYCGNIGYGIDEEYRGNHYSLKSSKLLIKLARKHKLDYVLINCEPQNIASNKICKLLDADFIEMVNIPETHEMYEQGMRQLNIYKINLN